MNTKSDYFENKNPARERENKYRYNRYKALYHQCLETGKNPTDFPFVDYRPVYYREFCINEHNNRVKFFRNTVRLLSELTEMVDKDSDVAKKIRQFKFDTFDYNTELLP